MGRALTKEQKLAQQAAEYFAKARDHLIQSLQPGNPRGFAHGISRSNLNHRSPFSNPNQGLALQSGRMPTDADVRAFIEQQGGNPYEQKLTKFRRGEQIAAQKPEPGNMPGGSSGAALPASGPAAVDPMASFNALFADAQAQEDRANANNEIRYGQLLQENGALRDRRQASVQNWGIAAQQDIDERMQESLSDAAANFENRGLANTNVMDSFRLRAARDTAREQQRVSEMRDQRANEYDAQDTANIAGILERRTDNGPDTQNLLQMALQYGLANQGKGFVGEGAAGPSQGPVAPVSGGRKAKKSKGAGYQGFAVRAGQGTTAPMWLNGTPLQVADNWNPQAFAADWLSRTQPSRSPAWVSNAYPTRKINLGGGKWGQEDRDAAFQRRMG